MITSQRLREALTYDPATGNFTWLVCRNQNSALGTVAGTVKPDGYRRIFLGGKGYYAQRLAWLWMTGSWPDFDVDHINRNRDDNRWENLREATRSQNCGNQAARVTNSLGLKGVRQKGGKFEARITITGRSYRLGSFATIKEAEAAYVGASKIAFGEFARVS